MFLSNLFQSRSDNNKISVLPSSEFKKAIQKKPIQLIDVRTPHEFAAGNIKGAKNMDLFNSKAFEQGASKLNKEIPVYLYCQSGNRSKSASSLFVKMGFSQVYDLNGGYSNWSF